MYGMYSTDERDRDAEQPVEQRHAARRAASACRARRSRARLAQRKDQEDQAQHEGQVHAAVRGLAQQAEAGRVVVEAATARSAAPSTISVAGGR